MGKPNIVTKRYMQDNARFADLCNFYLFDGQQVIKPENLVERDVTELGPLLEFINAAGSDDTLEEALDKKGKQWEKMSVEAIDLLNTCLDAKLQIDDGSEEGAGNMCKGIRELEAKRRAEGKAEGKAEGILLTLLQLVHDGLLDISVGIERSGVSEQEFKEKLSQMA